MEKNAIDSKVPEDSVPIPPAPPKIWTPMTVGLTLFVTAIVFGIVFFDTIVNQPMMKSFLTGVRYQSDKPSDTVLLPTSTPTSTPTPIILKPDDGVKGNYTVSQSAKDTGPTFQTVTFDPLDVKKGQTLTLTVTLSSQSLVSSVTGTLTSDTISIPITLKQTSQTKTITVWSATVPITDTLLYKYILRLNAVNETGTSSVTVAPRS